MVLVTVLLSDCFYQFHSFGSFQVYEEVSLKPHFHSSNGWFIYCWYKSVLGPGCVSFQNVQPNIAHELLLW